MKNWLDLKNINHFNLNEITEKQHNSFKSFVFDISFLDRDIIYDKTLWPRGIQVGKYKKKYIPPATQTANTITNITTNSTVGLGTNSATKPALKSALNSVNSSVSNPILETIDETLNVNATGMEHSESNIVQ